MKQYLIRMDDSQQNLLETIYFLLGSQVKLVLNKLNVEDKWHQIGILTKLLNIQRFHLDKDNGKQRILSSSKQNKKPKFVERKEIKKRRMKSLEFNEYSVEFDYKK